VPFAYLDTRHRCRVVEASKPYPVQTVKNGIWLRMPPFVALELRTLFYCHVTGTLELTIRVMTREYLTASLHFDVDQF